MRVGMGYDSHRFCEGRRLVLGGVEVAHTHGLFGHSDADALTHAVIDALLGAAKLGDIGRLFPDNVHEFKDISSLILLQRASALLTQKGYHVINIDATIIAQAPKLATYIPQMELLLAECLQIDPDCVSVKAKTAEGMGFVGRHEGIEVHAICLIRKGE